ncbi:MAG: hypothetical protein QXN23_06560 [Candidatus Caldarchaeum sp.]
MKVEHILKHWEKKYGYIALSKAERKVFSQLKGKRFTLKMQGEILYERHIDPEGRIFVGRGPLKSFEVGERFTISLHQQGLVVEKA